MTFTGLDQEESEAEEEDEDEIKANGTLNRGKSRKVFLSTIISFVSFL